MHAAPPVRVTLGRSRVWLAWVSIAAGVAAANGVAWALLHLESSATAWGAAAAGVVTGWAAGLWAWRHQAPGALSWDGSQWQWAGRAGHAQVAIDLNRWMLLRFEAPPGRPCWIAASRAAASGSWAALRAALYSRRPADPRDVPPA